MVDQVVVVGLAVALVFADAPFGVADGLADGFAGVSGLVYLFYHTVCRVQPADPYLLL